MDFAAASAAAPWTAELAAADRRIAFTLVDPASGAKVSVQLSWLP